MTTNSRRRQAVESLGDKAYRDGFVSEHINTGLAFQIYTMRQERDWTQAELGRRAGMAQERICTLENPDYGKPNLTTLKRLASAFDVALIVRFAPFSELVDWEVNLSKKDMAVPSFHNDPVLEAVADRKRPAG